MIKRNISVVIFLTILGCSIQNEYTFLEPYPEYHLLRSYDARADLYVRQHLIHLLIEVSLGAEYGNNIKLLKKWKEPMQLFVGSSLSDELEKELATVIQEINLLSNDGFYIEQTFDSLASNAYLFAGGQAAFSRRVPTPSHLLNANNGLVQVTTNAAHQIERSIIYVDTQKTLLSEQKHILREELTQGLGLLNDLKYYVESIFYEARSAGDSFSTNDREIIRLLYHPALVPGMDSLQIDQTAKRILGISIN
ncbi:MAG: DUF2927 domain-containing protein [Flavobacteriaceae bacterium]